MSALVSGSITWAATRRSRHELKPNGGGSLKDQLTHIAAKQDEQGDQIDYVLKRLDDHIDYHLDSTTVRVQQTITRDATQ